MAKTYLLAMRCPVCRRRDSHSGFRTERENLAGDAKGKGASGDNREAESTDALVRGGLPRSSDEAGVMPVERRGRVIARWDRVNRQREEPDRSTEGGSLRAMARAG